MAEAQVTGVRPACSCGTKFAPIEVGAYATVVAKRTCRRCKGVWSLTVRPVRQTPPVVGVHVAAVDGVCLKGGYGRPAGERLDPVISAAVRS